MTTTSYKRKAGLNATAYSYMVGALLAGSCTRDEVMHVSGMGPSLAARCIKALRDRGLLYVSGWRPDARGRMTLREYTLGQGTDMPCPKLSREEIVARYLRKRNSNN